MSDIYAVMLIVLAVVMAASLVSFAIAFDMYVLDREVPLPNADVNETIEDITNGKVLDSIVEQFKQLS